MIIIKSRIWFDVISNTIVLPALPWLKVFGFWCLTWYKRSMGLMHLVEFASIGFFYFPWLRFFFTFTSNQGFYWKKKKVWAKYTRCIQEDHLIRNWKIYKKSMRTLPIKLYSSSLKIMLLSLDNIGILDVFM